MKRQVTILVVLVLFLSLFGCSTTTKTAEDYLNENDYKSAYELYLKDSDSSKANSTLIKWYVYCMQNETIDDDLLAINIDDETLASRVFMEIKSYLFAKMSVSDTQAKVVYQLLVHNEEYVKTENCYELLKSSLEMASNGEYIWNVPEQSFETYDQYHSTVHTYTSDDLNRCVDKDGNQVSVLFDDFGMIVYTLNSDGSVNSQQYAIYGNLKSGMLIGNDGLFDGYWVYYVKDLKDLCRVSVNGEMQTVISQPDDATYLYITSVIVDQRTLFFVGQDTATEKTVIHSVYLPSLDHKEFTIDDDRYEYVRIGVPSDSEHIIFFTDNPEYIELLNKYNEDKASLYSTLSQYKTVDKDYVYNNNLFTDLYYDSEMSQIIRKVIKTNYGTVNRIQHNFDINSSEDDINYIDMAVVTDWDK